MTNFPVTFFCLFFSTLRVFLLPAVGAGHLRIGSELWRIGLEYWLLRHYTRRDENREQAQTEGGDFHSDLHDLNLLITAATTTMSASAEPRIVIKVIIASVDGPYILPKPQAKAVIAPPSKISASKSLAPVAIAAAAIL